MINMYALNRKSARIHSPYVFNPCLSPVRGLWKRAQLLAVLQAHGFASRDTACAQGSCHYLDISRLWRVRIICQAGVNLRKPKLCAYWYKSSRRQVRHKDNAIYVPFVVSYVIQERVSTIVASFPAF